LKTNAVVRLGKEESLHDIRGMQMKLKRRPKEEGKNEYIWLI